MPNYGEYLFTPPYGDQVLRPDPSDIPDGWTASEHFRALPGDIAYGVPVVFPGPDGWALTQFLRLQNRILNPPDFHPVEQRILREQIARCLPLFEVCADFPLTPDDIRTKVRNFHRRASDRRLYAEYSETPEGTPLIFILDPCDFGMLTILSVECHRDCLPDMPVTWEDYLRNLQEPVPSQD